MIYLKYWVSQMVLVVKTTPANTRDVIDTCLIPGNLIGKMPPEEGMATHSNILAWRIPRTEETGGLPSPWGHKESDTTE